MLGSDGPTLTPEPAAEQTVAEHTRRKPVRKAFPESWPRVPIEILPLEVQREGLDAFEWIGSDTRKVLERRPASTVVVQLVYKKFVRRGRSAEEPKEVLSPETVELPIERGLAGPGMLADSIVRRWQNHQPLHRLEGIYAREGLELAKSTLCTWHQQLAALARPLVGEMLLDALRQPYLCVDATGVLVLAKEKCRNGHFWVLVAPEKQVLYGYSKRRDSAEVDRVIDESPLSTAIGYVRNQRVALRRFLDDGRLPLTSNISELNLRRQVLGRRNWLVVGSDDGALVNTVFASLLPSARLHDIEPLAYLRDLLCLLPSWPRHRLLQLAPAYWKQTFEQPETQQKLAANVFRRVLLASPS
jgi:transposase